MEEYYRSANWFNVLRAKPSLPFLVFDMVDLYPSISIELLEKYLKWANKWAASSHLLTTDP